MEAVAVVGIVCFGVGMIVGAALFAVWIFVPTARVREGWDGDDEA